MHNLIPDGAEYYLDEYDAERFWKSVDFRGGTDHESDPLANASGECWKWRTRTERSEYGSFRLHGKSQLAHRVAYRDFGRKIPEGFQIDHLCRNKRCVNPAHLEAVTQTENGRRGINGAKTACPSGHEYSDENATYQIRRGKRVRYCAICLAASKRRTYLRRKNAA